MITLFWIKSKSEKFLTFVQNCCVTIQSLSTKEQWHHIASAQNCADEPTRPGAFAKVPDFDLNWVHGKEWIRDNKEPDSAENTFSRPLDLDAEERKGITLAPVEFQAVNYVLSCLSTTSRLGRWHSQWGRAIRIVGILKRWRQLFLKNTVSPFLACYQKEQLTPMLTLETSRPRANPHQKTRNL